MKHPKDVVRAFVDLFYGQNRVREAFEAYVHPAYIQHNPEAGDGREAAIAMLEQVRRRHPGTRVEVKRIIAEGDLVAVHAFGRRSAEDPGAAIVDIFRVEEGLIAEHWDVVQPMPATSKNAHPMF